MELFDRNKRYSSYLYRFDENEKPCYWYEEHDVDYEGLEKESYCGLCKMYLSEMSIDCSVCGEFDCRRRY